jgi:hypothetical protein
MYAIIGVYELLNGRAGYIWIVCAFFIGAYYKKCKEVEELEENRTAPPTDEPIEIDAEPSEVELEITGSGGASTE